MSDQIREVFYSALAEATGPLGTLRGVASAEKAFRTLRRFGEVVSHRNSPPLTSHQLSPGHLAEFRLAADPRTSSMLNSVLRRQHENFGTDFQAALYSRQQIRTDRAVQSYSESEMRRIVGAALQQVRQVRDRILPEADLLCRWREGLIDKKLSPKEWRRGAILDGVASRADVPRWQPTPGVGWAGQPNLTILRAAGFGSWEEAWQSLLLSQSDALAFCVLLVGLTGQNFSTLSSATVARHVATDPLQDRVQVANVELIKRRRGKHRAHMTVPLTQIPPWAHSGPETSPDDLRSPFGVYLLLLELGAWGREAGATDALFAWYGRAAARGGVTRGVRAGINPKTTALVWTGAAELRDDDGGLLELTFQRLRLTYVQHRDEPVAHSRATLRSTYQMRDRRDLGRYQRVVASVLEEQVKSARATTAFAFLRPEELEEGRRDPVGLAKRMGLRRSIVESLIEGNLDTVVSACVDNENGPHTPGEACQASFLLCAGCPCAVAMPTHWPLIVATRDRLNEFKGETSAVEWAERFAEAETRLADLVHRMPLGAEERLRGSVTDKDRELIERLMQRELDV